MFSFAILILLVSSFIELASSKYISPLNGRIIGGENTTIETYPYQVSIQFYGIHSCGGSIISENYVVTASHCFQDHLTVRAGATFWNSGGSVHQVESFIRHENYTYESGDVPVNDIAVIKVNPPFKFDKTMRPVELFESGELAKAGAESVVIGWGRTSLQSWWTPYQLQKVTVPIVSKDVCNELYKEYRKGIPVGQICTGFLGVQGSSPCHGDSGGALTINGKLAGTVSWVWKGKCGDPVHPTVYNEIASYRDWIRKKTNV